MENILKPEQRMYLILSLVSGLRDGYAGKEEQKTDYQIASRIYANAFTNMIRYGWQPLCEERDGVAFLALELEDSTYSCPARTVKNIMRSEFAAVEEALPEIMPLLEAEEERLAEGQKARKRRGKGKAAGDGTQEAAQPVDVGQGPAEKPADGAVPKAGAGDTKPQDLKEPSGAGAGPDVKAAVTALKAQDIPTAPDIPVVPEPVREPVQPVQKPVAEAVTEETGGKGYEEGKGLPTGPASGPLPKAGDEPTQESAKGAIPETPMKAQDLEPERGAEPVKIYGSAAAQETAKPAWTTAPSGDAGSSPAEETTPTKPVKPEPVAGEPVLEPGLFVKKPAAHVFQKKEKPEAPVVQEGIKPASPAPAPVYVGQERKPMGMLSRFLPKGKKQDIKNAMTAAQEPKAPAESTEPDVIPQTVEEAPGEWVCHTHYVMIKKTYGTQTFGPYVIQVWSTEVVEMHPDKIPSSIFVRAKAPNGSVICKTSDRHTKYITLEIDRKQFNVFGFWEHGAFVTEVVTINTTASMYTMTEEVEQECPEQVSDAFLDQFRSREPRRPEFFVVPVENVNHGEPFVPIAAFARVGDKNYVISNKGAGNTLRFTYANELSEISGRWEGGKFAFTIQAVEQE